MPNTPTNPILIVDDDQNNRATVAMLLAAKVYEISTAEHGFDALLQMKSRVPELVISDLNMPQMSGFEFLSVIRRRFPKVLVIAMSGAYDAADSLVADLFRTSASRAVAHTRQSAPVWVPRNGKDSRGIPYIVLTCTECLRSFPLNVSSEVTATVMETPCIFCLSEVRYIIDFSLSVASPKKKDLGVVRITGSATG
ncbi:MAG: hypothetical protein DMG64_13860 [Acidobacteria bacterium]|nr:MAG: hypothetical protein DMG64_13860 [Acidobacteriota bacterium]